MAARADYDTHRRAPQDESDPDSLQLLTVLAGAHRCGAVEADETDLNEALELPGADLSGLMFDQELTVRVVPRQPGEFTCSRCFLITPQARRGDSGAGRPVCRDCA